MKNLHAHLRHSCITTVICDLVLLLFNSCNVSARADLLKAGNTYHALAFSSGSPAVLDTLAVGFGAFRRRGTLR